MIVVVGCGVAGLSCATAIAERGHRVEVWADRFPPHTTSNVAAAFWYPYRADPPERVCGWAAASYRHFAGLNREPSAGVTLRRTFDVAASPTPRPSWADAVPTMRQATATELPAGFAFGRVFDAPTIDMRAYLPYLRGRAEAAGVRFVQRKLASLAEATADHAVVVNASGLGARVLANDDAMVPVRGQLVHLANPGIDAVFLDEHNEVGMAYIVPRGDDVVLGGTAAEHDEELAARPAEADAILERCARLVPAIASAARLADVVGLRPGRFEVRLEREELEAGRSVIHNYGHGGAGVTLSWGCALEVADLVGP